MNKQQRMLVVVAGVALSLALFFYFVRVGDRRLSPEAAPMIFTLGYDMTPVTQDGFTLEPTAPGVPFGIVAADGYSREAAALGGLVVPLLILFGLGYFLLGHKTKLN
jgi:hypothetical protein